MKYDPITNTWSLSTLSGMSTPRTDFAAAVVGNLIYALGGYNGAHILKTVEKYYPINDTWVSIAPMQTPRANFTAVVVGELLYALGGWDGTKVTDAVEVYDPKTNIWRSLPDLPTPRKNFAAVAINTRLYSIGGFGASNAPMAIVEEYNSINNTWYAYLRARRSGE